MNSLTNHSSDLSKVFVTKSSKGLFEIWVTLGGDRGDMSCVGCGWSIEEAFGHDVYKRFTDAMGKPDIIQHMF